MSSSTEKTRRLVGISIFAALVVVLQLVAGMIHFGPVSITLVLVPIVIGAAVYGAAAGAILGAVFGVVVCIGTISGTDVGANFLWNMKPFWTVFFIMLKCVMAGLGAGLIYRLIAVKDTYLGVPVKDIRPELLAKRLVERRVSLAVVAAAIVCPVLNTGIFCIGMVTVFREALVVWAGGADLVYYVFVGLVGVNFLVEVGLNILLSPGIVRIIKARKKGAA